MRKLSALALALLMTASFGSVMMAQAQPAPADNPPATTDVDRRDDDGMDLGWIGLLGLAGLLGLKRREPNAVRTTHTASATR